jgi:hypothetical protein
VSSFTMQSFKRVVRRHDREAILQHPTAWDSVYRANQAARRVTNRDYRARSSHSPVDVAPRHRTRSILDDPFEDSRYEVQSTTSSTSLIHEDRVSETLESRRSSWMTSCSSNSASSGLSDVVEETGEVDIAGLPLHVDNQWRHESSMNSLQITSRIPSSYCDFTEGQTRRSFDSSYAASISATFAAI